MKLNQRHKNLLLHRLESGCIAEVVSQNDEISVTEQEAQIACDAVTDLVSKGELNISSLSPLECAILEDSMTGATYFSGYEDAIVLKEKTRGDFLADNRAAKELEDAFFEATGKRIEFCRF